MDLTTLYGNKRSGEEAKKRFFDLAENYRKSFGRDGERFYSSPGRAEVLGNHTDHNCGKVMVAAINCDIIACASPAADKITVRSAGYGDISVQLSQTDMRPTEKGTSTALVRGVVRALNDRGYTFGGFTAYTDSNVFHGAGVSSSAAFEVLIAEIINDMYLGGQLTPVDKAVVSQYAENTYFGKPCGLLDQSGIAIGSLSVLDFENPERPVIEKLPSIEGCSFVITNTGGDHASLTPHYAAIREEMGAVASCFGKRVLREIGFEEFMSALPRIKGKVSDRALLRAMHFYAENARVERAQKAVETRDLAGFYACVNESGISSLTRLQNCSVPKETSQPVILAIEASREIIKNGAVRVHGGGFAGSVLAVMDEAETDGYIAEMGKLFGGDNVFRASIRPLGTARVEPQFPNII